MWRSLAPLIAASLLLAACQGAVPAFSYFPLSALRADGSTKVAFPSSERLRVISKERSDEGAEPTGAYLGGVYATGGLFEEVKLFYSEHLALQGWVPAGQPLLNSNERSGVTWCKPGLLFRLVEMDPQSEKTRTSTGSFFRTVYSAVAVSVAAQACTPTAQGSSSPDPARTAFPGTSASPKVGPASSATPETITATGSAAPSVSPAASSPRPSAANGGGASPSAGNGRNASPSPSASFRIDGVEIVVITPEPARSASPVPSITLSPSPRP